MDGERLTAASHMADRPHRERHDRPRRRRPGGAGGDLHVGLAPQRELEALFHARPLVLCLSAPSRGRTRTRPSRSAARRCCSPATPRARSTPWPTPAGTAASAWPTAAGRPPPHPARSTPGPTTTPPASSSGLPTAAGFEGMRREDKGLVQLPVAGLQAGRRAPPARTARRRRRAPRPRLAESQRCSTATWQPRRDPHPPGRGQLEGHPRHLPRELPLRLPAPDTLKSYAYGGVLTAPSTPSARTCRNCSAIRSIDELRELAPRSSGETSTATSATSTRSSPTRA